MDRIAKYDSINALKKEGSPIVIVSLVEEAEAVLNACKELNIKVILNEKIGLKFVSEYVHFFSKDGLRLI